MTLVAGIDSSTQNCKIVIVDAATFSRLAPKHRLTAWVTLRFYIRA